MTKQLVTFTLRDEYAGRFDGGNVAMWDGTMFDVKAALDAGGGTITLDPTTDEKQIQALAGYRALTHTVVDADVKAPAASHKVKSTAGSGEQKDPGEKA
jgi:hypothetical protein